jgi:putative ABC transport system permease protein
VLRRELGVPRGWGAVGYLLGLAMICALVLWKAQDLRLGLYVLGGFIAAAAVSAGLVLVIFRLLLRLRADGNVGWRYGMANLQRRSFANTIQVVALSLGVMALLTLTLIRSDLLRSWQATLRPDTPNRFVINIQPDQVEPLQKFFASHTIAQPTLFPMVRGRLVAINGRPVSSADYSEDRARRLIDREFNLSWAQQPPPDNLIVAGRWWDRAGAQTDQLSVEDGLAATLGIKLRDRLTYDVAGSRIDATITSLRKVDWDSFNVNFFVIAPLGLLNDSPVSYVTSFYVRPGEVAALNALVREFQNFAIIDIAQILAQVQKMMDQVSTAVQFVFLFTLAAGLLVLYAAIAGSQDERQYEAAIMRTIGAGRRQIASTQFAEFALMGGLAGLLAAAGATALGYVLAIKILNLPYIGSPWIWPIGVVSTAAGVALAGMVATRRVLSVAPVQSLRGNT